ncbi:MAG: hypothetical protein IJT26_04690 [Bacteroidales bacterium]|nr:hypothetical protein [Bacteroidales bacterium]
METITIDNIDSYEWHDSIIRLVTYKDDRLILEVTWSDDSQSVLLIHNVCYYSITNHTWVVCDNTIRWATMRRVTTKDLESFGIPTIIASEWNDKSYVLSFEFNSSPNTLIVVAKTFSLIPKCRVDADILDIMAC